MEKTQEFIILRTAWGIGDWGIISAMPRLLKEKHPNCKVYIPSLKLLEELFGDMKQMWGSWGNPFLNAEYVFRNNPYVDAFVDTVTDEIFHDHYRVYDSENLEIPLVEQMLDFWQFTPDEYKDSSPELYFTDEEKKVGDAIIKDRAPNGFGTLLLSNRFKEDRDSEFIQRALNKNKLPYLYYVKD